MAENTNNYCWVRGDASRIDNDDEIKNALRDCPNRTSPRGPYRPSYVCLQPANRRTDKCPWNKIITKRRQPQTPIKVRAASISSHR